MSISAEVKSAVDQIHKDKDLISSMRKADEVRDQQLADYKAQVAARPSLSDEDKKALTDAVSDMQSTNDALSSAVPANVDNPGVAPAPNSASNGIPLMPTSAFDPSPGRVDAAAGSGQPPQAKAIETAGGFVVSGGGTTQRVPEPVVEPAAEAVPEGQPAVDAPAASPEPSPGQLPFTTPAGQDAAAKTSPSDAAPAPIPPNPEPMSVPPPASPLPNPAA